MKITISKRKMDGSTILKPGEFRTMDIGGIQFTVGLRDGEKPRHLKIRG